jgi:uncharacterized membrane protein YoaK (UPF0700 family)
MEDEPNLLGGQDPDGHQFLRPHQGPLRSDGPGMPSVVPETGWQVAMLLGSAGGFLDAFTWLGHGGVFANAQSGNVVLLAVGLATAHWSQALRHIPPIVEFLAGVFTEHLLRTHEARRGHHRSALFSLGVEIVLLLLVAMLPRDFPDLPIVLGIAFVAALQNSGFTKVEKLAYNSVMTTGNLRRTAETFFAGLTTPRDPDALRQTSVFASICTTFAVGACLGAFVTARLSNAAVILPAAALALAFWLCRWHPDAGPSGPG